MVSLPHAEASRKTPFGVLLGAIDPCELGTRANRKSKVRDQSRAREAAFAGFDCESPETTQPDGVDPAPPTSTHGDSCRALRLAKEGHELNPVRIRETVELDHRNPSEDYVLDLALNDAAGAI